MKYYPPPPKDPPAPSAPPPPPVLPVPNAPPQYQSGYWPPTPMSQYARPFPDLESADHSDSSEGEEAEKGHRRLFLIAMLLAMLFGLLALLPLCFYAPLQESTRKRKYYVYGVIWGICLVIILTGVCVAVWYFFFFKSLLKHKANIIAAS